MPLEYYPFFDTYSHLCGRSYEWCQQMNESLYDGNVHGRIGEALDDELQRVYTLIIQELSRDSLDLTVEIRHDQPLLNAKQITAIVKFRQQEKARLEKEQAAWMACKEAFTSFIYSTFGQGSARLTYPLYFHNQWVHQRIFELRKRYSSLFTKDIQEKHLWGEWKQVDGPYTLSFQRSPYQEHGKIYREYSEKSQPEIDENGIYRLEKGQLYKESDRKQRSMNAIDIMDESDSLILEQYDNAQIHAIDLAQIQVVEAVLMREIQRVYQQLKKNYQSYQEESIHEIEDPEYRKILTAEYQTILQELENAQSKWLLWLTASFDERQQMLPEGSLLSLKHSSQRNQAIYDWIIELQQGNSAGGASCDQVDDATLIKADIFLGEWKVAARQEVWHFTKKGEAYLYHISHAEKIIEAGTYTFNHGHLALLPLEKSTRFQNRTRQLDAKDSHFWFKYLFGPLPLKNKFRKVSPL